MRISDLKKFIQAAYAGYVILANGVRFYQLSVAVTANSTLTSAPAGSFGITSHDTGKGLLFYSDGTKWQASDATALPVKATGAEVNTGSNDAKFVTPKAIEDSDYAKTAAITIAQAQSNSSITPHADGTYTPVTITIVKGIITAVTEA